MTSRIAIFASGSGSNAENIITTLKGNQAFEFPVILSNKADAFVHVRAQTMGIQSVTFTRDEFADGKTIIDYLKHQRIDYIVLAGFLLKIPENIIKTFPEKVINIHPALLPNFGGKGMYGNKVHEAVKNAGVTETGITIHYVTEHYDEGNIIFQAQCPVEPTDSPADIANKVHALEYKFYPAIIQKIWG